MTARIILNDRFSLKIAEIGLETVMNKQLFNYIFAEQVDDNKVTVSFKDTTKAPETEALKWEISDPDLLYINVGNRGNNTGNVLWFTWSKPNDKIQKGFCFSIHNVEWVKYENENENES